jgi:NADP-dependent 3-hydroxy acid dehydrogenase YdfG
LGARRVDRLETVAARARQAGSPEVHVHFLDVGNTPSVETFMKFARKYTHRLDVLINNAGGAHGLDHVTQARDEDWEAMFQSNVFGLLRVTRSAVPLMQDNPGASILNIGSLAGRVAYEGGAAYCAAKAGELQISRALRLELNGTGIRVCSVDPGLAETEFSLIRFKGDAERARKTYEGTQPLTAQDIAEILVWVANRPAHVNIDELLVKPVDQAAIHKVYRRKS